MIIFLSFFFSFLFHCELYNLKYIKFQIEFKNGKLYKIQNLFILKFISSQL